MISRYFVIALALGTAVLTATRHEWVQTAGLASLALGLIALRLADVQQQPQLKKAAWVCFAITLVAVGAVLQQKMLN